MAPTGRFTHVALPVLDLERSIEFYREFTPLRVLQSFRDDQGQSAWLIDESQTRAAFVLVLVSFNSFAGQQTTLAPFAHLGIEVESAAELDEIAARARDRSVLEWEPRLLPPPVGYVCALRDPDGNIVEISFDQGVHAALIERFGDTPTAS